MTTANLLRTLLIPIVVLLGVISFGWRSRFWAPMYIHLLLVYRFLQPRY